jgi:3-deoxy-D-manno-octulosonic-acid transferase
MKVLVYNLAIRSYNLLIHLASPFNKKANLWVNGRNNYFINLQNKLNKKTGPIIWFHSASLGEFEQTRTLIEKVKKEFPNYNIVLTFFSPSGYEIRKNYEKADFVFYLPIDTPFNARKFVRVVNPRLVLFAKYEFWYHFLFELNQKKIPVISFSAIFRPEQAFFKSYKGLFVSMLSKFKMIFVQNQVSLNLLSSIGINQAVVAGDTRFDRVKQICDNKKSFPLIEKFKGNKKLFIAGSTWSKDIAVLLDLINHSSFDLKIIIAPHEIHETEFTEMEKLIHKKTIRYSHLNESTAVTHDVLLIDNIGMLSSLYQYGEFGYIGGAFGKGLHNVLEAAIFGMPIFFGPNHQKFNEALELIELGVGISINNGPELVEKFNSLYQNEENRKAISFKSKTYVESHTGATDIIFNYCKQFLEV